MYRIENTGVIYACVFHIRVGEKNPLALLFHFYWLSSESVLPGDNLRASYPLLT